MISFAFKTGLGQAIPWQSSFVSVIVPSQSIFLSSCRSGARQGIATLQVARKKQTFGAGAHLRAGSRANYCLD
jgi:hypothetical protein